MEPTSLRCAPGQEAQHLSDRDRGRPGGDRGGDRGDPPGKLVQENRPGGIRVSAGQVGTVQARGPTRYDQRPDDGADRGRSDDQMRRVGPHEVRAEATIDFELGRRDHRDGDSARLRLRPVRTHPEWVGSGLWRQAQLSATLTERLRPGATAGRCPADLSGATVDHVQTLDIAAQQQVAHGDAEGSRRRPGECVGEPEGRVAPGPGRVRPGRPRRGSAGRGSTRSCEIWSADWSQIVDQRRLPSSSRSTVRSRPCRSGMTSVEVPSTPTWNSVSSSAQHDRPRTEPRASTVGDLDRRTQWQIHRLSLRRRSGGGSTIHRRTSTPQT